MSADLESTSEILGEYMLKGWTLTDLTCSTCRTTPLMREPQAQARAEGRNEGQRIEFCARCQGGPPGSQSAAAVAAASARSRSVNGAAQQSQSHTHLNGHAPHLASANANGRSTLSDEDDDDDDDDLDSDLSDEDEDPDVLMVREAAAAAAASSAVPSAASRAEPEQQLQTAAPSSSAQQGPSQSDLASSRISTLLLRGYSLLAETCPGASCRGVPLMGTPRRMLSGGASAAPAAAAAGGRQASASASASAVRKECVICGTVYGADGAPVRVASASTPAAAAVGRQEGGSSTSNGASSASAATSDRSVEDRKAALYELGANNGIGIEGGKRISAANDTLVSPKKTKKRAIEDDEERDVGGGSAKTSSVAAAAPSRSISRAEQALSELLDLMTTQMRREYLAQDGDGGKLTSLDLKTLLERMKEVMEALEVARRVRA